MTRKTRNQSDNRQPFPKANSFWRVDTPASRVAGRGLGGCVSEVIKRWLAMCCGILLLTVSVAVETRAGLPAAPDEDRSAAQQVGTITGKVTASGIKDARDTVVYIDRIEGAEFPAPVTPADLRQVNKEFIPHVLPILKGSSVSFSNSDGILHNVHLYRGRRSLFNLATPADAKPITKTFRESGEVAVLCDVHPEMSAYIIVLETPYAAVTTEDGHYTIADVPPGTYTLKTWHEKLKPVTTAVIVKGENTVEVNVELK